MSDLRPRDRKLRERGFWERGLRERGQASLEFVAMLPFLFFGGSLILQAGTAMWALSSTNEATREAARAYSLGYDARAAAQASLPGVLKVSRVGYYGPGHGVELAVDVPRVSILPTFTITRRVLMP